MVNGMALSGLGTTQINGVAPMTLNTPNTTSLATAVTQFTNGTINGAGNLSIGGKRHLDLSSLGVRAIDRRHGDGDRRLRRHPHGERLETRSWASPWLSKGP